MYNIQKQKSRHSDLRSPVLTSRGQPALERLVSLCSLQLLVSQPIPPLISPASLTRAHLAALTSRFPRLQKCTPRTRHPALSLFNPSARSTVGSFT